METYMSNANATAATSDGSPKERTPPKYTLITNAAKFSPGQIVATPGALALMQRTDTNPAILLNRHLHGDWGDICADDAALNEQALADGSRIMSVYRLVSLQTLTATPIKKRTELPTVGIITEAVGDDGSRASICILLPEDY
jgi:hypothetical protein